MFRKLAVNDHVVVSGEDAHHLARVLRTKPGDKIRISDGRDTESLGEIIGVDHRNTEIELKIVGKHKVKRMAPFITLIQGLVKGEKFYWILQKRTELGVRRFVPVTTQKTVVKLTSKKIEHRIRRWKKIVKTASKQCMRMDIPQVERLLTFDLGLEEIKKHNLSIIAWEKEKTVTLKKLMKNTNKDISSIAVLNGPEGGFTIDEIRKAEAAGAVSVSLGPRILRAETAATTVCNIIMYELGDIGG